MNQEPSLFDPVPVVPYARRSEPSIQAARKIAASEHLSQNLMALLVYIQDCGPDGATEPEIVDHFHWKDNYARPRIWTLCGNAPKGKPKPPVRIRKRYKPTGELWPRIVDGQKYTVYLIA